MAFTGRRWVALLKGVVLLAVSAEAQAPPGYVRRSFVDHLIAKTDRPEQTASYTTSIGGNPEACFRGTSVFCPCNEGFACIEIAPCRWKCLEAPTAIPSTLSTILPSVSAYISSSIPIPISTSSAFSIPSLSPIVQTTTSQLGVQSTQSPSVSAITSAATYSLPESGTSSISEPTGDVIVITVTQRPSTCPIKTTTVFTTSTSTGCPSEMICPSQAV